MRQPIGKIPRDNLRRAGMGSRGCKKGDGAKGLLIRRISEESPIFNIEDESDRSEDDPDRSEGI